jgi:hypothetical protein
MHAIAERLWSLLGGDEASLDRLDLVGEPRVLPSIFDVTGLATASIGVATLAVAELRALRAQREIDRVTVTTREAAAAFRCEHLFAPVGWDVPPLWDPIAGDYAARDGWIRLHTNYDHHRAAALRALGVRDADRPTVQDRVADWSKDELESRVVAEGGVAAAMRTRDEWLRHPHGHATASALPVESFPDERGTARPLEPLRSRAPLSGVRVLDLTRVIAGPFGTRVLAAWGADVLRIDPPAFEEVAALVPEATAGKRCTFLDLREERSRFVELVRAADVVVHGYRPGALDALGFDNDSLREVNPALIISQHTAYGWTGPWAERRGFDSLVQMSCGIAAEPGGDRPQPLPAQVLDHTTAMLIAAAVCRALTTRTRTGSPSDIRASLIGTANLLYELPDPSAEAVPATSFTDGDTAPRHTWWGPARAVPIPGRIGDARPRLTIEPGPLGRHEAVFAGDAATSS